MFIFAGNDSTSTGLLYAYHVLSLNPHALSALREEHDTVFGSIQNTANVIKHDPILLNKCKYTVAVIKETLRLYPPASTIRQGRAGGLIDRQARQRLWPLTV